MAVTTIEFDTGPATLADVDTFMYNGCLFSPLFETTVSGTAVKDNAQRTVKYMEYLLTADGYVTMPDGDTDVNDTTATLRELLTAQGGSLVYRGRGCDIIVNEVAGSRDVAWGPVPELLEFQPLGGGRSAKVRWQVKTRIPEVTAPASKPNAVPPAGGNLGAGPNPGGPVGAVRAARASLSSQVRILQFNYETAVTYAESGYSSMSIRGTLELPLTRVTQSTRTLTSTVDDVRAILDEKLLAGIDLNLFRVVRREFSVSRDKRTMEFDVGIEEKPYMDLPPGSTLARGTYDVRPAKTGVGLCNWLCTLRATYTVRADYPRRWAWFAFLYLLRLRMAYSQLGNIGFTDKQNPGSKAKKIAFAPVSGAAGGIAGFWKGLFGGQSKAVKDSGRAWLIDFSISEGIYLDSTTVTFSATWRLVTTFSHILLASGLWRKLKETNAQGSNLWATYMKDIQGSKSWMPNRLDPRLDIIVDFGS